MKLECIRGFAAFYVFVHHLRPFPEESVWFHLFRFGQEGVIIFFLLSGFVIHFSYEQVKDRSFRYYFVRRFRRIYPLFVISMLLTLGVHLVLHGFSLKSFSIVELVGNLTMLQDVAFAKPNTVVSPFMGNLPLWSLSYEWWFYMLYFPMVNRLAPRNQCIVMGSVALFMTCVFFVYPNQLSRVFMNFCIWWLGVEMARSYMQHARVRLHDLRWCLTFLSGVTGLLFMNCLWKYFAEGTQVLSLGLYPILEFRHCAFALGISLLALLWQRYQFRGFSWVFGIFAPLAPISYGIYIFHYPVIELFAQANAMPAIASIAATFAVTLVLAYLTEKRLQVKINQWLR